MNVSGGGVCLPTGQAEALSGNLTRPPNAAPRRAAPRRAAPRRAAPRRAAPRRVSC